MTERHNPKLGERLRAQFRQANSTDALEKVDEWHKLLQVGAKREHTKGNCTTELEVGPCSQFLRNRLAVLVRGDGFRLAWDYPCDHDELDCGCATSQWTVWTIHIYWS